MSSLKSYLAKLEASLGGLPPKTRQAVTEELRGHLEDRATALQAGGLEEKASMSEAIERFGEAKEIGAALRDVYGRSSWAETLVGMVPFLSYPIVFILGSAIAALEKDLIPPGSVLIDRSAFALTLVGVYMVALGVGWVKGFPRWCYPYWALGLAISTVLVGAATPGLRIFNYTFGSHDLWGWRAWIPVLVVAVIALLLTRSVRPLRQLVTGVWHDWTRLSFGFYGLLPLTLLMASDGVRGAGTYMAMLWVILAMGALAYMRSSRTSYRMLALVIGTTLAWGMATAFLATYWHGRQEYWMREARNGYETAWSMLIALAVLMTVMFAPALLGLLRKRVESVWAG